MTAVRAPAAQRPREGGHVNYQSYERTRRLASPIYWSAALVGDLLSRLPEPIDANPLLRSVSAWSQTVEALKVTHTRPAFGIEEVALDGETVPVTHETLLATPFASLRRFSADSGAPRPRVLILPGLAGHFSTLVRDTIETMVVAHDVCVADWHNARDVPVEHGPFGLDEFIEQIIVFLEAIGPGAHLMAVCQPCPAALAAAALMAEDGHPAQPGSLILMAGPVDARVNPGRINRYANAAAAVMLERAMITTVPRPYEGHGRRVYPGYAQLAGFVGLDPTRHGSAFTNYFLDIAAGRTPSERTRPFYEEFFAVLDIAAEFYADTARAVFRDHDLPRGELRWRTRRVDPTLIRSPLLTIEAANDELCPPGQTVAAHELCSGIPSARRRHHLQDGVGHYGVFSGSRFRDEIYPRIRDFVAEFDAGEPA
jgi:poly(3-hydroxybutyrate) depolymerase